MAAAKNSARFLRGSNKMKEWRGIDDRGRDSWQAGATAEVEYVVR